MTRRRRALNNDRPEIHYLVFENSEDPAQPPALASVPDNFHAAIGGLIAQWSILEQEVQVLLAALLAERGHRNGNWMTLPFSKRWQMLLSEWNRIFKDNDQLISEIGTTSKDMLAGKFLRDSFAHKRAILGLGDNDIGFVRFENKNAAYPWTKRYFLEDVSLATKAISNAAGRLYRISNSAQYPKSFSQLSLELLQKLPNMDAIRHPAPRKLKGKP